MADTSTGPSAVGLSLGNTAGAVAVAREDGRVEIVANDLGLRTTPAMVAYLEEETLVGQPAKNDRVRNAKVTVANALGALARKPEDEAVAHLTEAFKRCGLEAAKKDKGGVIQFGLPGRDKAVTASDAVTHVLSHLKGTAEAQTGSTVASVVLAVDRAMDLPQLEALRQAAGNAGLHVARFISEPVAALMAYGIGQEKGDDATACVLHIGGTESCATVVNVRGGTFSVVAEARDTGLSGAGFDAAIVNVLQREFKRRAKIDVAGKARPQLKLAVAAEEAKIVLSTKPTASVSIDGLAEGVDLVSSVARTRIDAYNAKLYTRAAELVTKAVAAATDADAGITMANIDTMVLSGGGTNATGVKTAIEALLVAPKAKLLSEIPGEEVVALGAANQAVLLGATDDVKESKANEKVNVVDSLATDVCLVSSSAAAAEGAAPLIIASAGTPYPLRCTVSIARASAGETSVALTVAQRGKGEAAEIITPLADLVLTDLSANSVIEFVFEVNKAGKAKASLRDTMSTEIVAVANL